MMHKDRDLRYNTGAELVEAIDHISNHGAADAPAQAQMEASGAQLLWQSGAAVICPHGALGQNDSQHWRTVLEQAMSKHAAAVIINCLEVKWVSSEGLALLVSSKPPVTNSRSPSPSATSMRAPTKPSAVYNYTDSYQF